MSAVRPLMQELSKQSGTFKPALFNVTVCFVHKTRHWWWCLLQVMPGSYINYSSILIHTEFFSLCYPKAWECSFLYGIVKTGEQKRFYMWWAKPRICRFSGHEAQTELLKLSEFVIFMAPPVTQNPGFKMQILQSGSLGLSKGKLLFKKLRSCPQCLPW